MVTELPQIKADIFLPILERGRRSEDLRFDLVMEMLNHFREEQEELSNVLGIYIDKFADDKAMVNFVYGFCLCYKVIKNQIECEELSNEAARIVRSQNR